MLFERLSAFVRNTKAEKYEPKPIALPLWNQVYWFAFFWSVIVALVLIKIGLNPVLPTAWDQSICVSNGAKQTTEPLIRVFVVDYAPENLPYNSKGRETFEYIKTNYGLVHDLCGFKEQSRDIIHDSLSQQQVWEQILYDKIIPDVVIEAHDTLNMPIDVVFLANSLDTHCFGKLPLTQFINAELVLVVTHDALDGQAIDDVLQVVRNSTVDTAWDYEGSDSRAQTFMLWARVLRYVGILLKSNSACYDEKDVFREALHPKHDFADLISTSFQLVLFGPVVAAIFVSLTSRVKLLLRTAVEYLKTNILLIRWRLWSQTSKPHVD